MKLLSWLDAGSSKGPSVVSPDVVDSTGLTAQSPGAFHVSGLSVGRREAGEMAGALNLGRGGHLGCCREKSPVVAVEDSVIGGRWWDSSAAGALGLIDVWPPN